MDGDRIVASVLILMFTVNTLFKEHPTPTPASQPTIDVSTPVVAQPATTDITANLEGEPLREHHLVPLQNVSQVTQPAPSQQPMPPAPPPYVEMKQQAPPVQKQQPIQKQYTSCANGSCSNGYSNGVYYRRGLFGRRRY